MLFRSRPPDLERADRLQHFQLEPDLSRPLLPPHQGRPDRESVDLPLQYIEPDLALSLSRLDLRASVERELDAFMALMKEVETQSGAAPDVIYVTGGTAKSPMIEECIRASYGGVDIVVGDLFGSVASGLATWAHRTFR